MGELNAEELYARSRTLFVDLLKLGLSLSTGIVAALSFLVFKLEKSNLSNYQVNLFTACLILLSSSIAFALIGWLAQAMFYSAWASFFPDEDKRRGKWGKLRNVCFWGFAFLFLFGVIVTAIFIHSFLKSTS